MDLQLSQKEVMSLHSVTSTLFAVPTDTDRISVRGALQSIVGSASSSMQRIWTRQPQQKLSLSLLRDLQILLNGERSAGLLKDSLRLGCDLAC